MFSDLIDIIVPRRCPACGNRMLPDEHGICLECLVKLPRVHGETPGNKAEQRLSGCIPFEHGTAFCLYAPERRETNFLWYAKYGGMPWLNAQMTQVFVRELRQAASPWPYDIDCIIPIPIHRRRLIQRGYNQSAPIAEVLGEAWHLPVIYDCLTKAHYTNTQVDQTQNQRVSQLKSSFVILHPERLVGRHILLVDDVLTSGATLEAAYEALRDAVPQFRISFMTLAIAVRR